MTSQSTIAEKAALRQLAKARRATIPAERRRQATLAIADRGLDFLGLPLPAGTVIGGYMPIGEEMSPLPLMERLVRGGCRLALPVMAAKTDPLIFRAYAPGDALKSAVWGIREPGPTQPVLVPAIVLVAMLAFDARGYRLGYGGGYYDRTLRALRANYPVIAIGLAYDEQQVDAVPRLEYDEQLDWLVTPSGARRTGS
jgi:5-formyltetrahydrofolate cyclo-ligase